MHVFKGETKNFSQKNLETKRPLGRDFCWNVVVSYMRWTFFLKKYIMVFLFVEKCYCILSNHWCCGSDAWHIVISMFHSWLIVVLFQKIIFLLISHCWFMFHGSLNPRHRQLLVLQKTKVFWPEFFSYKIIDAHQEPRLSSCFDKDTPQQSKLTVWSLNMINQ